MARLLNKAKSKLIPVEEVEGLYLVDPSLDQIEEMQKFEGKPPREILMWFGENLLRDENGDKFDDFASNAEVGKLGLVFVGDLIQAVRNTLEGMAPGNATA